MHSRPKNERRTATRYNLRLPTEVTWVAEGRSRKADTITRDVSTAGLFLESNAELPVGTHVDVSVTVLPQRQMLSTIQLTGSGVVVRPSETTETPGFAIAIKLELPLKANGNSEFQ